MINKIAVLTSGGDCPGMNAAIRGVVRAAQAKNIEVFGVHNGYVGLIGKQIVPLDSRAVSDTIHRGGTFLGTARSEEFRTSAGQQKALANLQELGIDGLVVIGGDGSLSGARILGEMGMKVAGIPGTIDNDLWGTEYTVGADTAVNTVVDAIDKIRDTASAHGRVMVVEVMGRESGWIALTAGFAGGAELILIPEIAYDLNRVCERVKEAVANKHHCIIVIAEGAGNGMAIGDHIHRKTGLETRVSVLGHIQRGGSPTVFDRVLASRLGAGAVKALLDGKTNVMLGCQGANIVAIDFADALGQKKVIDAEEFNLASIMSI
ncbi:atp-dependent 6-phosphofructokinase [Lucifera butyrica]|uniref:ATP-dependent 6-phosphofructokinase n=1 Tax=Lucifera butyrica TaxID=1351585 RepID=A0A498R6W7_9FIRM|nr:6-phosphofructokinase [Lucifera butyrica]VBB06637.1 atp-dependent 6-phosphofructokinase [Lucifera butyrica]